MDRISNLPPPPLSLSLSKKLLGPSQTTEIHILHNTCSEPRPSIQNAKKNQGIVDLVRADEVTRIAGKTVCSFQIERDRERERERGRERERESVCEREREREREREHRRLDPFISTVH